MVSSVVHLHTVFFHICTLAASRVCHLEFNAEHQVQVSLVDVVFSSLGSFFSCEIITKCMKIALWDCTILSTPPG